MIRMIKKVKSGQNDQFGQKLRKCQRTEKIKSIERETMLALKMVENKKNQI